MIGSRSFDFIIAGQGIAGSCLAISLQLRGASVLVVDPCKPLSSSRVAAGLIHPITGRRLVKTWQADVLIPFAIDYYRKLEAQLHTRFFNETKVLEVFHDHGHRNDWMAKTIIPEYQPFLGEELSAENLPKGIVAPLGGQWVINCGWLSTNKFLDDVRDHLKSKDSFIEDIIEPEDLNLTSTGVQWNGFQAQKLIDCRGYHSIFDDWFRWLPFNPAKGEVIHFECDQLDLDFVVHDSVKIIPLPDGTFVCGATFTWNEFNEMSTVDGKKNICNAMESFFRLPYQVTSHVAGVRPSTRDRRPFLGVHPIHNQLAIFNGMGSKGVMLAPYFSSEMADYLAGGKSLSQEVGIERVKYPD